MSVRDSMSHQSGGMDGQYCGDLSSALDDCQGAGLLQLELYYKELEEDLEKALKERIRIICALRQMDEDMARIDGESAVLVKEIEAMKSSLADVSLIIDNLQTRSNEMAIQADKIRSAITTNVEQQEAAMSMMEGENRAGRLRGALIDLYSEQLILKAGFLAYTGSLKGASHKARITREINDQTKRYIKEFPVLKAEIHELRERISSFKTATAELTVQLRDQFEAERQQTFVTAREHKYLCQLYEEESNILDRLDADLKLQLDSATEVAAKLTTEMQENQTYFKSLQERLQISLLRESKTTFSSKFRKKKSVVVVTDQPEGRKIFSFWKKSCPNCSVKANAKWCPGCSVPPRTNLEDRTNIINPMTECDQKRAAMRAQMKYLEHKIHQLEIEVYISKMNVEIQMLQTSLKIEKWKKSGYVPPSVQLSGLLAE